MQNRNVRVSLSLSLPTVMYTLKPASKSMKIMEALKEQMAPNIKTPVNLSTSAIKMQRRVLNRRKRDVSRNILTERKDKSTGA